MIGDSYKSSDEFKKEHFLDIMWEYAICCLARGLELILKLPERAVLSEWLFAKQRTK